MRKLNVIIIMSILCLITSASSNHDSFATMREQCFRDLEAYENAKALQHANVLLNHARLDGNRLYEGYGLFFIGVAQLHLGQSGQAYGNLLRTRDIGNELHNDTLLAYSINSIAIYEVSANLNMYIAQHDFMEALKYAKRCSLDKLGAGICGNLAEIAILQNDTINGIKYARQCYDYGHRSGNDHYKFMGSNHLASLYHKMGRDTEALKYIRESLSLFKMHHFSDIAATYLTYSSILFQQGNLAEAMIEVDKAVEEASQKMPMTLPDCYLQKAKILSRMQRYDESNRCLQQALGAAKNNKVFTSVVDIYEQMSDNYDKMGDKAKALVCMRKAKQSADSINITDREHMVHEREMLLDMAHKEQQTLLSQLKLTSTRRLVVALAFAVLLLFALLASLYIYSRKRNRLFKKIVRQNTDALEKEQRLRQHNEELLEKLRLKSQQVEPASKATLREDKSKYIYTRLCALMDEEHLYTDSQLNRESLAERLGTNRTYLTKVIQEQRGMSLPQFINSYRINEAVRQLSAPDHQGESLKDMCSRLGFSSMSNFYRLFQAQMGMSPQAYRKYWQEQAQGRGETPTAMP